MTRARRATGIRHEDNFRFQTLRPMHGHDANLVAAFVHVALDLCPTADDPVKESLHGGRMIAFELEREIQEFVNWIVCIGTEPRQQLLASAFFAQHMCKEFKGRFKVGAGKQAIEQCMGILEG